MASVTDLNQSLLTNIEVAEFLRDIIAYEVPFLGVLPLNDVPLSRVLSQKHWLVILNLDQCFEAGSHFVVLCRNPDGRVFFFDSAALPMLPAKLVSLVSQVEEAAGRKAWCMKKPIQPYESKACGYFCIYFTLMWHLCDTSYDDMNFVFESMAQRRNLKDNEVLVYKKIRMLIALYVAKKTAHLRSLRLFDLPIFPKLDCKHPNQ